jgi:bisanhydrobacterioruberin hydratase
LERPQSLKLNPHELAKGEQLTLIIIIVLFHLVGLIGFCIPSLHGLFLELVPWHLLLMLIVVSGSHRPLDEKFLLFAAIVFVTTFAAEWVGVHTGWLFGKYGYGSTLGTQLGGVPLCVCANWFLLVYSTGVLMQRSRIRSMFIRVLTGALLLVLLDLLIEPTAVKFDYWHWDNNVIPLKNYACWFLLGGILLFVFEKCRFRKHSIVAPVFLGVQFVFFVVLWLMRF